MKRCPCCGYLTIDDSDEIITDICEVCYWHYDETAQNNPELRVGPNRISLNAAKANYLKFQASDERFIPYVRQPYEDEL